MRNLATIQRISAIYPIEGRDRIVLAAINGWQVIVKKDEFKGGDLCIYCEIDSVLPDKPEFEFLRKGNFRIKTMKMAGVVSQGICFPLSILPVRKAEYAEGEDVTKLMGVTQYAPTMDKELVIKPATKTRYPKWLMRYAWFRQLVYKKDHREGKGFPSFLSKTDETRIQNAPHYLLDKQPFVVTEKIDGQSGTFVLVRKKSFHPFIKPKYEYIVCSRNLRLYREDNSSYWRVSERYNIQEVLKRLIGDNEWVAIQGECIAPNVQKNKYKVNQPDLYVFNLIYPNGRVGSLEAKKVVEAQGLHFVPIVDTQYTLPDTASELLEHAHGQSAIGDTLREGLVIRSQDGKTSFKAVDPLFLIAYDE